MSVSRGLVLTALCILPWGVCGLAVESSAQVYEDALRSLDMSADPIARSPRLLGMGRLTLADDPHNRINLWDFAANPLGVGYADSVTTFELRPSTSSSAGVHTPIGSDLERQDVASREVRTAYEAWRRTGGGTAYGFYGDAATLRTDGLYSDDRELRSKLLEPRVRAVLNGAFPHFQNSRLRYAVTGFFGSESRDDEYRTLFYNATGEYLGKKSATVPPPDNFTPDQFRVATLGGSAGLSYRPGDWLTAAVGAEGSSSHIQGENSDAVHDLGTGQERRLFILQTSAVGRGLPVAKNLPIEWGYDGRFWGRGVLPRQLRPLKSSAEENWVFTIKAGINQESFGGRGKLLDREENGVDERFRIRWWMGALELGGAAGYSRRGVEVRPPDPNDLSSFNHFISIASQRDGADSLALPDSVTSSSSKERAWNVAYGATWKLKRGVVGLEYTYAEQKFEQFGIQGVGPTVGPHRRVWDVRSGLEYRCSSTFTGRLGYIYRSDDRDLVTQRNEYTSHTVTSGISLTPAGSMWSFDLGWAMEFLRPDFPDETGARESRQQLASQVRWVF